MVQNICTYCTMLHAFPRHDILSLLLILYGIVRISKLRLSTLRGSFEMWYDDEASCGRGGQFFSRTFNWTDQFSRDCVTHFHPSTWICCVQKALSSNTNQQRITCNPLRLRVISKDSEKPSAAEFHVTLYDLCVHTDGKAKSGSSVCIYLPPVGDQTQGLRMATCPRRMPHGLPALDRLKRKNKQIKCTFRQPKPAASSRWITVPLLSIPTPPPSRSCRFKIVLPFKLNSSFV